MKLIDIRKYLDLAKRNPSIINFDSEVNKDWNEGMNRSGSHSNRTEVKSEVDNPCFIP